MNATLASLELFDGARVIELTVNSLGLAFDFLDCLNKVRVVPGPFFQMSEQRHIDEKLIAKAV